MREKISMDKNWKFHLGDFIQIRNRWAWGKSGSWNQGPESIDFDDSKWRAVTLPHDFVIEGAPTEHTENEFDDENNAIPEMQTVKNIHTTSGSFEKNIAWYRKHFYIPAEDDGRKIYFIFDGIYRDSMIYVNNFFVESHRSGYTGICCDITDFVNYGGNNVISVRVDSTKSEGWFYEGGGIYRHTYLLKTEKIHIDNVFITSDVNLVDKSARVNVRAQLNNSANGDMKVFAEFEGKKHMLVYNTAERIYECEIPLDSAVLWDVDNPHMYSMNVELYDGSDKIDVYNQVFGVRDIKFDTDKGFFLNGKNVKIKGVCCHQNHGGLGVAIPDEIYTYRIKKLKEMGCNAYRTSHYPPTPQLLDVCDRLGMLVMDETRLLSSANEDLAQLEFMVKRDRNHPSVIMYSIGNEEAQSQTTSQGAKIAGTMIEHIRALDSTRPITMGLLMWDLALKRPLDSVSDIAGIGKQLDIAGFNYHEHRWEEYHRAFPNQPVISTEMGTFKSTRGCYKTDTEKCHLAVTDKTADSYMKGARQWAATRVDYMSGLFLWTGFDYYGEPTPYAWPAISSQFGIMDICGYPKDYYYYYKAWWNDEPLVHIFPHWNGVVGEKKDVHVFSNCDEVELFVNGNSLDRKKMEKDGYLEWENVEYIQGHISAIGYKDGKKAAEKILKTTGKACRAELSIDFKENDVAVIKATILDAEGNFVPDACNELFFEMSGNVQLLGSSNGDPSDHTPAHSDIRKTFNGLAQIIVRVGSGSAVTATADGLECNTLKFD